MHGKYLHSVSYRMCHSPAQAACRQQKPAIMRLASDKCRRIFVINWLYDSLQRIIATSRQRQKPTTATASNAYSSVTALKLASLVFAVCSARSYYGSCSSMHGTVQQLWTSPSHFGITVSQTTNCMTNNEIHFHFQPYFDIFKVKVKLTVLSYRCQKRSSSAEDKANVNFF